LLSPSGDRNGIATHENLRRTNFVAMGDAALPIRVAAEA